MGAASTSIRRIIDRRADARDDDRHLLGDDDRDVLHAVRYVRSHRRVPVECLRADVLDAIAATEDLLRELKAEQSALLVMARGYPVRLPWQRIAGAMRMSSRQGAIDRLRRLQGARQGKTDVETREDAALLRRRERWLATDGREELVRELAGRWTALAGRVPDEWADDVADLAELTGGIATAVMLRDLARQLDAAGPPADLVPLVAETRALTDGYPSARADRVRSAAR